MLGSLDSTGSKEEASPMADFYSPFDGEKQEGLEATRIQIGQIGLAVHFQRVWLNFQILCPIIIDRRD